MAKDRNEIKMSPLEFRIAKYFCKFSDEELAVNWGFEKNAAARIRRKYNEARLHEEDHFDELEWHQNWWFVI